MMMRYFELKTDPVNFWNIIFYPKKQRPKHPYFEIMIELHIFY